MTQYHHIDINSYIERVTSGPCFICEILAGNPNYKHHIIYQDETAIVFLNKFPILYGYTLVAPRKHCEHVTSDFTHEEYLALQALIYRVSEALSQVVPTERMYILSLGSQQGNSHVHWHIAPLPPDVPLEEQQFEALRLEKGILTLSEEEMAGLAARIRQKMLGKCEAISE
ncbi:MAG: HIT family protein [Chloroflexi bacterium]|nr:HIT family protein [Chloroflexota bacterium]